MNYIKIALILGFFTGVFSCKEDSEMQMAQLLSIGFTESKMVVAESDKVVEIPVELSTMADRDVTIEFIVDSETNIEEDLNYILPTKKIVIKKGEKKGVIDLEMIDDKVENGERMITLRLIPTDGLKIIEEKSQIAVDVFDDESGVAVVFEKDAVEFLENEDSVVIPFEVIGDVQSDLLAKIEVKTLPEEHIANEGEHFVIEEKEVRLTVGELDGAGVQVHLIDDKDQNPIRYSAVRIIEVIGGTKLTSRSICKFGIRSDDLGLTLGVPDQIEENPTGTVIYEYPIKLEGYSHTPIEVEFSLETEGLVEGVDYIVESKVIRFEPGDTDKALSVDVLYNELITGDRTLNIQVKEIRGTDKIDHEGLKSALTIYDYNTEISVDEDYLGLLDPDLGDHSIPIVLSRPVHHDIRFKLRSLGTGEGDLAIEGEDYYLVKAGDSTIMMNINYQPGQGQFRFTIDPILGLVVKDIKVDQKAFVRLKERNVNKATWSIPFITSEELVGEGTNGGRECIIDDNENSFWHSQWNGGAAQLPHYFTIAFEELWFVEEIEVTRRKGNVDVKSMNIYFGQKEELDISAEEKEKRFLGRLEWSKVANEGTQKLIIDRTRRDHFNYLISGDDKRYKYITFEMTESNRAPFVGVAEVNMIGWR